MFPELFQQSGLSLDRLHTFCAVAKTGSISKAAAGDANAQSLFSRQIKELEEYFGVELVRRSGRGLIVTGAGKRLARMAHENLAALAEFKSECAKEPRRITVAAGDSLMRWLVLPRLERLRARLPDVSFTFLNLQSDEILRRLHEGTVDFGVVRGSGSFATLKRLELGVLTHTLFTATSAKPNQTFEQIISNQPIATLEGDGVFRREMEAALLARGLKVRIQVECSSFPLVARAAKTVQFSAILPTIASDELCAEGFRGVHSPVLKRLDRKIALVWSVRTLRVRPGIERAKGFLLTELKF